MATNDAVINPGTEINFTSSGGDVVITMGSVAFQAGRKSDLCTLATNYTDDRPVDYRWTAKAFWGASVVIGETVDLYLSGISSAGNHDGSITSGDAAFSDKNSLLNIMYVGSVVCTNATAKQEHASGFVRLTSNKLILVAWNNSAAANMHATSTNFGFRLLPIPFAPSA